MIQEEKNLLLKDLCARLPYQVKVSVNGGKEPWTLKGIFEGDHTGMMLILEPSFPSKDVYPKTSNWQLSQCKPYLRLMSSMTEEEREELKELTAADIVTDYGFAYKDLRGMCFGMMYIDCQELIDWLNKKMFDFRGLIDKDIALSTEIYNPYKD